MSNSIYLKGICPINFIYLVEIVYTIPITENVICHVVIQQMSNYRIVELPIDRCEGELTLETYSIWLCKYIQHCLPHMH